MKKTMDKKGNRFIEKIEILRFKWQNMDEINGSALYPRNSWGFS